MEERIVIALDTRGVGAVAAVQDLLWRLMEKDIVQGLLVPLQTHPSEAPAPTLIKSRERLEKANPFAPVMTLNSARIVGLLLAQDSKKRLAAVMRPCEVRALVEVAKQGHVSLNDLITISVDCLGSHDEGDYEQRVALWGTDRPTHESLRWSRRGQIAAYRFRQACQICVQPYFEQADIAIGLLGQDVERKVLVFLKAALAQKIGLDEDEGPFTEQDLLNRRQTLDGLVLRRTQARRRLLAGIERTAADFADLKALFDACTLCGDCQEACPITPLSEFDMGAYSENTPEYVSARLLDIARRSEFCAGCGMCEAACRMRIPLALITQMLGERPRLRRDILIAI